MSWRRAAATLLLAVTACGQSVVANRGGAPPVPPRAPSIALTGRLPLRTAVLSGDRSDAYTVRNTRGGVRARALRSNTGVSLRKVFWPADGRDATDAETCAVWASQTPRSLTQQGAALRIASASSGTRAITVTKNVWGAQVWAFNFHAWDSSRTPPVRGLGSVDLAPVFSPGGDYYHTVPLPWHLCARTIEGRVEFKAWPDSETEPAWGDASHGGSVPIPSGWEASGKAGWYVGHLSPGASADYTDLETRSLDGRRAR